MANRDYHRNVAARYDREQADKLEQINATAEAQGGQNRQTDSANWNRMSNGMTAAQRAGAANDWERNQGYGDGGRARGLASNGGASRRDYAAAGKTMFDQNMKAREFNAGLDKQLTVQDGGGNMVAHPGKALTAQFGALTGDAKTAWKKKLTPAQRADMTAFGEIERQRMPLQTQEPYQEQPQQGFGRRQSNPYLAGANRDINTAGWSDKRISRSQGEARHRRAVAMGPSRMSGTNSVEGIGQQMEGWDPNGPTAVKGTSDHGIFQRDDGTYTNYGDRPVASSGARVGGGARGEDSRSFNYGLSNPMQDNPTLRGTSTLPSNSVPPGRVGFDTWASPGVETARKLFSKPEDDPAQKERVYRGLRTGRSGVYGDPRFLRSSRR